MDPIPVPRPPKEAYNKNRPISDLIKAQIKHFQHLESKLSPGLRAPMPHHELTTESAAAAYIAHMTAALCRAPAGPMLVKPRRRPVPIALPPASAGIALAAAAEPEPQKLLSPPKKHEAKSQKREAKPKKARKKSSRGKRS